MRHRPAPSPLLAAGHLVAAAICLAFPLVTIFRVPGYFMTRLFSRTHLLEEGPPLAAALFLLIIGIGLLRRTRWVRPVARASYWIIGLLATLTFLAAGVFLIANQLSHPVRPFGVDIFPLAALAALFIAAAIVVPAFSLAVHFTRKSGEVHRV